MSRQIKKQNKTADKKKASTYTIGSITRGHLENHPAFGFDSMVEMIEMYVNFCVAQQLTKDDVAPVRIM